MDVVELVPIRHLFQQIAPGRYWRSRSVNSGFQRQGIFSLPVVIWMMMAQHVQPYSTLVTAVQQLRAGCFRTLLKPCKRVREKRISAATGGYCRARHRLSKLVVRQIVDDLFERLQAVLREGWPELQRPIFLLDGSTLLLDHTTELTQLYPPSKNQHGRAHWPVLRVAVAHDVESGLAARPSWGAAGGANPVSEQELVEQVIERLPSQAVVMGDRNFGVFSVAWTALQHGNPVIFRLTNARAAKLLGHKLEVGTDCPVIWRPSPWEQKAHPHLPQPAAIQGRVIICELKGARDPMLCLFTSLALAGDEVFKIYALRWNIETDLRSLKRTVQLHHIHVRSSEMMEKELLLAVAAYNFVRTVMCLAARKADVSPRHLSFTSIHSLIEAHLPRLLGASSIKSWRREMDILVDYATAYKLPRRTKPRSYPRAVWGTGFRYRSRHPKPEGESK
jgi:putative transposase